MLGDDRRTSRNELRKLAAYAQGQETVTIDDVLAAVSDAGASELDVLVDAAFAGRPANIETQFARALGSGASPQGIVGAALRHAAQLHRMSLDVAQGTRPGDVLDRARIFFKRKATLEAALRTFSSARLLAAMLDFARALAEMRTATGARAELDESLARAALLRIALQARARNAA